MADIELVIKIPEEQYNMIFGGRIMEIVVNIPSEMYNDIKSGKDGYSNYVHTAIRNGTPLPEGHGKLVDLDQMCDDYWDGNHMEIHSEDLKNIKTIIDADTEDKEQEETEKELWT